MKRVSFICFLALLGVVFPFVKSTAQAAIPDGTIPSGLGVQLKGHNDDPGNLAHIAEAGFTWVRRGFIWESIEKEKGSYDFSRADAFLNDCEANGLTVLACMAFNNKLYGHVKDEPARSAYAAWAAAMADHFRGRNIVFEIWNEPNTMTFWGKHGPKGNSPEYAGEYTLLVKETTAAMKKVDKDCIILAGSVSNLWSESYNWITYCFRDGMMDLDWDIWSVHPYGLKAPEDYINAYSHVRHLMSEASDGRVEKRVWFNSERGFPLGKNEGYAGGDPALAEDYQAWHLIRQYLIDRLEGVPVTIWYEWSGNEGFSLWDGNKESKALQAFRILAREFNGYKITRRIENGNPRDFILLLEDSRGRRKIACWTAPPEMNTVDKTVPHPVTIRADGLRGKVKVLDLYGDLSVCKTRRGAMILTVTGSPQYIILK